MKLPFKPNIKDKVVVITGGAGVLGSDFAKAIAACGAKVAILDLSLERAQEVALEIKRVGFEAIGVKANVLEKDSLVEARETVLKVYGTCDILINGAGGNHPKATTTDEFFNKETFGKEDNKSFFDLDLNSFNFVFGLNFTGTLLPTQIFAVDMVDKPGSVILNVSSMNAFTPLTKIPAYSAAKAAVSNFTQWLAVHFAKSNIRVNAIAPGFFSTEQNKALLWNEDGTQTARSHKILNNTPMGRYGEPEELIGTLLWLIDNDSSGFVTGVVIPVDGGFSAYSGV
ncbi:SDR family oxidoreductase [Peloplasma aerotolerans]|uniref:SDR family oxidoreductase n=1 Tax=Peloplasma aerotolerans TaxID=3044389 RepID=A0AAW6U8E7_9MOLU|nr:SDR family oxidoreductase [Mariniplasma sp. M4Ah]MDI6453020.1 SDR family oxidoreductase [Mariniplasma sp. M4Ah]